MVFSLSSAIYFENTYNQNEYNEQDVNEFEQTLWEKERILDAYLRQAESELDSLNKDKEEFAGFEDEYFDIYKEHGISVFFYTDNQLEFWTDNLIPVPTNLNLFSEGKVLSLGNSIYVSKKIKSNFGTVVGLILIKTENPYENKFLQNGFQEDFKMDPDVQIFFTEDSLSHKITSEKGEYVFSLDFENTRNISTTKKALSLVSYFIFFLVFLTFIRLFVHTRDKSIKNVYVIGSMVFIVIIMKVLSYFQYPFIVFDLDLFSAIKYSSSFLFSSIGDLFAVIFLLFFIVYNFYVDYIFSYRNIKYRRILRSVLILVFMFITLSLYIFDTYVFKSLIVDSSISFETYKVLDLSVFSFIGFFMLALIYIAYLLLTDKLLVIFANLGLKRSALIFISLQILAFIILFLIPVFPYVSIESLLLFSISSGLAYFYRFYRKFE